MRIPEYDALNDRRHAIGSLGADFTKSLAIAMALTIALALPATAQDEADQGSFFDEETEAGPLTIGGKAELQSRVYLGEDAVAGMNDASDAADLVEVSPSLRIDLGFSGASSELEASLRVDETVIADNPADALEEATLRSYLGNFILEAGKMKVVWGKGDKLHVLDLFNANDYTDFIFPDYIDRRLAEGMARVTWNAPRGARVEAVWTPVMTPDRVPLEGVWSPAAAQKLVAAGTSYVSNLALTASMAAYASTYYAATGENSTVWSSTAAAAADAAALAAAQTVESEYSEASALLPNTQTLDYGQYGLRATGSIGGVDLGLSYYLGHYKTPSVYATYGTNSLGQTVVTDFEANYDRLQSFGLEAGTVLGPLNLRGEAAYYLTDDPAGDDPTVKNNSLNWLAGFDVDLPVSQLNLNVQTLGSYILGNDGIASALDVDYDSEGVYTNNKLVLRLSDSLAHDKITPEISALWGIEREDFILMPKCAIALKDDMKLELSGAIFLGSDSGEFGSFVDNHFVEACFTYVF